MRTAICIVLTIGLFLFSLYIGPNKPYIVEGKLGAISLEHTAPRGATYAIPGDRDKTEEEIRKLGAVTLEVIARPAPGKNEEIPLVLQGRVQGEKRWEVFPASGREVRADGSAVLFYTVPGFPWTTRVEYRFVTPAARGTRVVLVRDDGKPMLLKFKGPVPAGVLIPHIILMFAAVCLLMMAMWAAAGTICGRDVPSAPRLARWAWYSMFLGGVPFGMAMNYYAFDVFWEAVPFGRDITDNKTQVALVFWGLAAVFLTRRPGKQAGIFALAAGFLSLAMYLIPHSL